MLLNIVDAAAAKQWLSTAQDQVTSAVLTNTPPDKALQIAFSVNGLRALGLEESVIEKFSDEFIIGMSGDESRSRRLGDVGSNAPEYWAWGGDAKQVPHVLLLLYALPGGIENWKKKVKGKHFSSAFAEPIILPTEDIGQIEPFGFADGISQPSIDWSRQQSTDVHKRDRYSNLLATGEVVFGYRNEYGLYTPRPLIEDKLADVLPNAEDVPALKDFGRNGTYLVLRQLDQDVPGFWKFVDKAAGSVPKKREELAASMVGRNRDEKGTPLVPTGEDIPGIESDDQYNRFTYNADPGGNQCPIGAHIRRANPRTGDLPPGVTGCVTRLIKILGFGGNCQEQDLVGSSCFHRFLCWLIKILGIKQGRHEEDLVASSRFHRLLRRGRSYGHGPKLEPEDAIKPDAPVAERGLQFICLVANISRQFEFVQNAWSMSSKFSGVQHERDPLLGHRKPLMGGDITDQFNRPNPAGPKQITCSLPQFITVRGGGYFFMPGLRALKYLATLPTKGSDISS